MARADLLDDMHHYAKIYSQIDNAEAGTDKLKKAKSITNT